MCLIELVCIIRGLYHPRINGVFNVGSILLGVTPCCALNRRVYISFSEVVGPQHHGSVAQGVTGTSEVVPLDAVELPYVVAHGVVDAIQVGETAGVEPPAWRRVGREEDDDKMEGGIL